jgi:uncharacterized membrane protein
MNTVLILATFAHNLSSVILVGYYLMLCLVFLPVLIRHTQGIELGKFLNDLSMRMLPWIGMTILLFILSGSYLMMANPAYHGIGKFGNLWSITMLVKHGLIVVMIAAGVILHFLAGIGLEKTAPGDTQFATLKPYRWVLAIMSGAGVLVLLLTAIAQAQ